MIWIKYKLKCLSAPQGATNQSKDICWNGSQLKIKDAKLHIVMFKGSLIHGLKISQCNKSPKLTLPARKGGLSSWEELSHEIAISSPFFRMLRLAVAEHWTYFSHNDAQASIPKLETQPCLLFESDQWQMYSIWLSNDQKKESELRDMLFGNSLYSQKLALKGTYMWLGQKNAMLGHWDLSQLSRHSWIEKSPEARFLRDHAFCGKKGEGGCTSLWSSDQEMNQQCPQGPTNAPHKRSCLWGPTVQKEPKATLVRQL